MHHRPCPKICNIKIIHWIRTRCQGQLWAKRYLDQLIAAVDNEQEQEGRKEAQSGTPLEGDRTATKDFWPRPGEPRHGQEAVDRVDRAKIVMESLATPTGTVDICKKYGLSPNTFYPWREKFLEGGKAALVRLAARL